jgi:hypothetical protein
MLFNYKFKGDTSVSNNASSTEMKFSPDVSRDPTFFDGTLNKHIPFREAISALHDIVVSDYRFKPKDKTDYKAWAAEQESIWLAEFMKSTEANVEKISVIQKELLDVRKEKEKILAPFNKAKQKYFNHIYNSDRDMWIVLDPIITVHPDELFFECFSKDESSYGRLMSLNAALQILIIRRRFTRSFKKYVIIKKQNLVSILLDLKYQPNSKKHLKKLK